MLVLGRNTSGECRVYAACNVYFLARHASNRQSLGKAGAVEALVLLLHESMQGKRPTDPEGALPDARGGEGTSTARRTRK